MAAVGLRAQDGRSASAVSALGSRLSSLVQASSQRCSPTDMLEARAAGQPRSPIAAM